MDPERIPNIAGHSIFDEHGIIEEIPLRVGDTGDTEDSFAIGVKTRFLTLLICNWFHLQLVSFAIGVETHGIVLWLHFF